MKKRILKAKYLPGMFAIIVCMLLGCRKKEVISLSGLHDEKAESQAVIQAFTDEADEETAGAVSFAITEKPKEKALVVHICGAVQRPGVYELSEGSRIHDAVKKAGGFTKEAEQDFLNQAQKLTDGMKLYIPTAEEALKALEKAQGQQGFITGEGLKEQADTASELININTATEAQLCTLSGIGSGKAQSIIAYRTENGSFQTVEDIMKVEGIKEGLFQKIKDSITV